MEARSFLKRTKIFPHRSSNNEKYPVISIRLHISILTLFLLTSTQTLFTVQHYQLFMLAGLFNITSL